MATIDDVKTAAEAAKRQRGYANKALERVIKAGNKAGALEPRNQAVNAAAAAGRHSVEAWTAAMEVDTSEARDYAEWARDAAVDAKTDATQAGDVYNEKPD